MLSDEVLFDKGVGNLRDVTDQRLAGRRKTLAAIHHAPSEAHVTTLCVSTHTHTYSLSLSVLLAFSSHIHAYIQPGLWGTCNCVSPTSKPP